jgi:hypothetical protein
MINKENIKSVLKALDFEEENNVFSKYFLNSDAYLKVDFNNGELIYYSGPQNQDNSLSYTQI